MAHATRRRHAVQLVRIRSGGAPLVTLESLARETGLHPDVIRRFVQFGLVAPRGGTAAAPLFGEQDAPLLARAARLRRDLGVNYAGAVLASELLTRIEDLEQRLRGS
jgi:DNA-binding transcriptional MerR regulator